MKQLIAINVFQCELKSQSKGKGFKRTFLTIDDCPSWCFWARLSRKHWWDVGNLGTIAQICRCLSVQRCRLVLRAVTFVGVSELERCPWTLFVHRMPVDIRLDSNLGKHKTNTGINCDVNKIFPQAGCSLWRLSHAIHSPLPQQLSLHGLLSTTSSLLTAPP